jgi:hypothetical protein
MVAILPWQRNAKKPESRGRCPTQYHISSGGYSTFREGSWGSEAGYHGIHLSGEKPGFIVDKKFIKT